MTPIHIIDCNNYVRRRHEVDTSGLALRNLFNEAYHCPNPCIFVFDGKDAKASRRKIYPGYKAKRKPAPDTFYAVLNMFKELLTHSRNVILEIPGYEADDVIAHLVRSRENMHMKIFSNDGDFMQLCNEFITLSDPTLSKVAPEDIRLYKTLVGDSSDSIPGLSKFGEGAWLKLTPEQKLNWKQYLNGTDETITTEALGLTPKQLEWTLQNSADLLAFWEIVNFIQIPPELVAKHTVVGKPNLPLANELLRGVFQ